MKPKKKKKSKREKSRSYADDDDEFIDLLREQELFDRTGVDIYRYRKCFYLNLLLLEYPLSVLEGCIRALLLCVLMVTLLAVSIMLFGCCSSQAAAHSLIYFRFAARETVLTAAATLSLAIPFAILFIYRDYDTEHAWDLSPLPTVIGEVDARRFFVVTMGQGSEADNVDVNVDVDDGVDIADDVERDSGAHKRVTKTHDSWGNGSIENIFLFPRVFLKHLLD